MKQTRVGTVMRRDVMTAEPDTSLYEVAALLREHGINGLPVVDSQRRVVGVVGIKDVLRVPFRSGDEVSIATSTPLARIAGYLREMRVRDVMATRPLCAGPDDPLSTVVEMMVNRGVHPVPVVDGERRLLGLVGRADILGAILRSGDEWNDATATSEERQAPPNGATRAR